MTGLVARFVGAVALFMAATAPPPLIDRLLSSDWSIRGAAQQEFAALPAATRESFLPALMAALNDPARSSLAISAVASVGGAARPGLRESVRSASANVRAAAIECVWTIRERQEDAVPSLIEALHDPDARVRMQAASGMEVLGPIARPALPAVIEGLQTLGDERMSLIRAVARMGPEAKSAGPALVAIVSKTETSTIYETVLRPEAAAALGTIHADPAIAGPALVAILGETESRLSDCAVVALASNGNRAIPYLSEGLAVDNAYARRQAAEALRRIGSPASAAVLAAFADAEHARMQRDEAAAGNRIASREEALSPPPPTPEEGAPLTEIHTIELPLGDGAGNLLLTAHEAPQERRDDVLTIWRSSGNGYRRLVRLRESTREAVYTATIWRHASRVFLHVVRKSDSGFSAWRLDRVWLVPDDGPLREVTFAPPKEGCGAWLPKIGTEEQFGAVLDFTSETPRFGFAPESADYEGKAQPPRWRGTLRMEGDDVPRLVVDGCGPSFFASASRPR